MQGRDIKRREFINGLAVSAAAVGASGSLVSGGEAQAAAMPAGKSKAPSSGMASNLTDLTFSKAEYENRYAAIRRAMDAQGIDVLLITGNREWREGELSNLRYVGAPIDWEPGFVIFPRRGMPKLLFKSDAMAPPFFMYKTVMEFEPVKSPVRQGTRNAADHGPAIAQTLKKMGMAKKTIGLVTPRLVPAEVLTDMQKAMPNADYVDAERLMLELRYVKSEQEINFLRRSAFIADKGIEAMIATAQVGATDWDLYFAMDKACTEAGAPPGGMQILSSGPWRKKRSVPLFDTRTARTLQPGDVIVPEVTSSYQGYFTQLTVPVVLGEPDKLFKEDLALCEKVYDLVFDSFTAGATVKQIDDEGARYTEQLTGGKLSTKFAYQAGEHETSFWHDNITV
ncbi:MAG: M24 family metallopeptidase, partial [Pseudomonadales bacterium]